MKENNKLTAEEAESLMNAVSPREEERKVSMGHTTITIKSPEQCFKDIEKSNEEIFKLQLQKNGISSGVNVDYHKIMDESDFSYADWYEDMMDKRGCTFSLPVEVLEKLSKKRKFGIEKYGDKSFQASFEASMTSPVKEHAKEELIDALNYLIHMSFILETNMSPAGEKHFVNQAIDHANSILELLDKVESL